ncbi:MAG: creatininase family protein [Alphaproteobacteria bacterium]
MRWEEMTAPDIDALDRDKTVVLLPLGSVEQHGQHLPVGTDSMLAHAVALEAVGKLTKAPGVVLPPPWYGFSNHHMAFAGTVTVPAQTLIDVAENVVESVVSDKFRRIVIVNGHGGNAGAISVLASTVGHRYRTKARIAALTYFQLARNEIAELRESESGGTGHAGEFETAMLMHLRPDLVKMDGAVSLYPDPGSTYLTTDLLGASSVHAHIDFKDLSPSGTFGDPSLATPEKGERFFDAVTNSLARFIEDFAGWTINTGTSES